MKVTVKKVVSILLVAVMLLCTAPLSGFVGLELFGFRASAVEETDTTISGTIGTKLSWSIDKATKVLTIDNDGAMVSFASDDAPWRNYKAYFNAVVINEGCTNISQNAFYECDNIVSVDLPDTVEAIGDSAFYGCTSIKQITIPQNVSELGFAVFYNCLSLEDVDFSNNQTITFIPQNAFAYCSNISKIDIPKSVTEIYDYAFSNCTKLSEINDLESVAYIGSYAFDYCQKLETIKLINCTVYYNAFQNSGIVSVDIDNCLFKCERSYYNDRYAYTFKNCSNLKTVKINNTDIPYDTFNNCKNIETIEIKGDCEIYYNSFSNIDTLKTVSFECTKLNIGSSAFYDCDALTSVSINCSASDEYNSISSQSFYSCDNLESSTISVGIDSIESDAFANCPKLEKVTIYNKNCSIAETAISIYSTIYGYSGSTAETFANTYGYNFVSIDTPCEHTYSNDCDTSCNICGETRETGAHGYSDWTITKEASCNKTGLRERTCSICGDVDKEIIEMLPHADEDEDGICEVCNKQFEIKYPMHGVCGDNLTWELDDEGVLTIEGTGAMYDFKENNYIMISDGTSGGETTTAWATTGAYWTTTAAPTTTRPATTKQTTTAIDYPVYTTTTPNDNISSPHITHPNGDNYYEGTTWKETTTRRAPTTKVPTTTKRAETTTARSEESTTVPSTTRPESTTAPATAKAARVAMYAPAQTTTTTYYGDTSTTVAQSFPNKEGYITIIRWNLHFDKIKKVVIDEGVTSIGDYTFANCTQITDVEMPASITNIGYRAFINCSGLKEIEIPENVRTVENYAFQNCSILETLNFNAKNYKNSYYEAFYNCNIKTLNVGANVNYLPDLKTVETVTFTEGTTIVPDGAFSGCEYLISVTLPDTIETIGENAFYNCTSLESINIPDSVTEIKRYAFYNCSSLTSITIPQNVASLGYSKYYGYDCAFYNCTKLETVNFRAYNCKFSHGSDIYDYKEFYKCPVKTLNIGPGVNNFPKFSSLEMVTFADGTTTIPNSAFYDCSNLKTVSLPNSITKIGNYAFYYCNSLVDFKMPEGVVYIGDNAFYNCDSLTEVTIPESVEEIRYSAFGYCYNLLTVNFKAKNCILYNDVFYNSPIKTLNIGSCVNNLPNIRTLEAVTFADGAKLVPEYAFSNCTELTSVNLPDSIETIGYRAFDFCSSLESIKLPKNLKTIGERAFYACYNLKTADLPDSVKTIRKMAFDNCTSLEKINLPDTVEYIGQYAFYGCTSVPSITIPENVSQIGYAAFGSCYALESVEFNAADCAINSKDIFYGCNKISSVKIGSNVTKIPALFMKGKENLASVEIPSSVKEIGESAFRGTSLTIVNLPNGVETIGADAFGDIATATEITIPETVQIIKPHAFANMTSLKKINFNAVNANIDTYDNWWGSYSDMFANSGTEGDGITVVFGDSVEAIPAYLFEVGSETAFPNIKNVVIGSNVKTIGDYAFYHCCAIENVEFGENVETIGEHAFDGCFNLKSLELPESLKTILYGAFYSCDGLTEITIPENADHIDSSAFGRCSSLEAVNFNAINCNFRYAFNSCLNLTTVKIGNRVEVIPAYAFTGCDNLKKVYIPDIVINIDPLAFDGCGKVAIVCKNGSYANVYAVQNNIKYILEDNIKGTAFEIRNDMLLGYSGSAQNVVLPSKIDSVGIDAFNGNGVVKSIEIPYNVSMIYSGAFANCPNLERVIIPFTVTDISSSAFTGTNATIYCYYNSYAYNYAVANNIKYELITVTLSTNSVNIVETEAVTVDAVPSVTLASGVPLVWKSENPAVASVDSTGKIVGNTVGNTTVGIYALDGNMLGECSVTVGQKSEIKLEDVSTDTLKYGEKIILHVNTSGLPDGATVKWTTSNSSILKISNENAECSTHENCTTCTVESIGNGSAEIKATVVDKNDNPIVQNGEEVSTSYKMNSKAGFFQKIIAFFKKLFGLLKTYPQAF